MKSLSGLLLASLALPSFARNLAPIQPSSRIIGLDIERKLPADIPAYERNRLRARSNVVEVGLDNMKTLYFANISLGTPPQQLQLHIDTGSSDMWVNSANSSLCKRFKQCEGGAFDPAASSSVQIVNNQFNISYVDGTSASGNYVSDVMLFGNATLNGFQFGIGDRSTSSEGVLGIGYVGNEMQVLRGGMSGYPNLPMSLVQAGLINRNAYSLWLNDLDASTGTILFGGINTAKYQGELATLPILATKRGFTELSIALTGLAMHGNPISLGAAPLSALLDSGATLSYLPRKVAEAIYAEVDAIVLTRAGAPYAPCEIKNRTETLDFNFSGKTISVAYDELLIDLGTDSDGEPVRLADGRLACLFGVMPVDVNAAVLGDTFLRSAYVVYDLDNNEISLAQTIFNATGNDIQEIPLGSELLPGADRVKDADGDTPAAEQLGVTFDQNGGSHNAAFWQASLLTTTGVVFMSLL